MESHDILAFKASVSFGIFAVVFTGPQHQSEMGGCWNLELWYFHHSGTVGTKANSDLGTLNLALKIADETMMVFYVSDFLIFCCLDSPWVFDTSYIGRIPSLLLLFASRWEH